MGLSVLFTLLCLSQNGTAKDIYVVQNGDSLWAIAKKTGLSITDLKTLNQLKSTRLSIGQRLSLVGDPGEEEGGLSEGPHLGSWPSEPHKETLLGSWSHSEEPRLLAKVALGFLGAPYRFGGSSVTGIDCSAFVKKIYQIFDIELPRTASEQSRMGMPVPRQELTVGDLIFFKTKQTVVDHVGIYLGGNEFVHASSRKRGVRIDNLDSPYYDKRFAQAVRLKELYDSL